MHYLFDACSVVNLVKRGQKLLLWSVGEVYCRLRTVVCGFREAVEA